MNASDYAARLRRVLEYIETNLDGDLRLEELSGIAAFSKFHFHRQFTAFTGVSLFTYVQALRMRKAAQQLAFRPAQSITDIGLESGFENSESFSRAFKKLTTQTPSAFRSSPDWDGFAEADERLGAIRRKVMSPESFDEVEIVSFPETRVAVLEHRGDPRRLGASIRRFIDFRKRTGLHPRSSATFNFLYDDPASIDPESHRFGLAAATDQPIDDPDVVAMVIPSGRCARLRHVGSDDHLASAVNHLYGEWLSSSGEEPRDFPLFFQRVSFFPDVPEREAITDIYLPLR